MPITLVAFAIAAALPGFAHSPWVLFALMLFVGATTGALDVAINVRAVAAETAWGVRVLDGLHAAFSAGVLVGAIGTGFLRRAGVHPTPILVAVAVVLLATGVANVRTETLPSTPRRHAALARPLLIVGAILAVAFIVESGVENWSALFIENTLHASPAISGLGPGLFAAAMVTGRVLAQRAAPSSAAVRMTIAGGAAAVGVLIAAVAQHPAIAILGFVIAGGGLALSAPTLFRAAGHLGAAPAISTVAVLGYAGFTTAPPAIGGVAAATSLRGGLVFIAAMAVILVATVPILRRLDPESHR